jgi:hypothetical protein
MSVQANTYAMIGAILPFADNFDLVKRLEPYMDSGFKGIHHHNGLCVLFDGMNGDYIAVGRVVAKSANNEGFVAPVRLPAPTADEIVQLRREILQLFPGADFCVEPLVITHYR